MLGVTEEPERIPEIIGRYSDPSAAVEAYQALQDDWDVYLSTFTAELPDPEMQAMVNVWNPIQCRANLFWSRFASGYDTGLGRGMGTRDSAQDTLGTVHNAPEHAKGVLRMLWQLQFADGHTWHQVFPLSGEGGPGSGRRVPGVAPVVQRRSLVAGDRDVQLPEGDGRFRLSRRAAALPGFGAEASRERHACGATWRTRSALPSSTAVPTACPRLGFADWDDTMNLDHGSGLAESVWTGQQFCRAAMDFAELAVHLGRAEKALELRRQT